jgi:flagella basal body P-ring formation protein FlgA
LSEDGKMWRIFAFCLISVSAFAVFETDVQSAIIDFVLSQISETATVTDLQFKQSIPSADRFEILSCNFNGNKTNILIKFYNNRSFAGYVQASALISQPRKILIARRTIKSGEIIKREDVELVEFDVFGKKGNFTNDLEVVAGKVSRKMFREGEPIDLFYLVKAPDVRAGQVLLAVFETGSVLATALVRVLHDGNFGEIVKARNVDTGFLIQGILRSDYTILISGG